MAGEEQDNVWPLPKFFFSVEISDIGRVSFQEVSGLDVETQVIEYRAGNSPVFSTIKMPGMIQSSNVTMRKGIFVNDNKFWDWFSQIKMNTIARKSVTISLLDQEASPTMVWKLSNAFPVKIQGTDLKADGNEVAVETLEIAHEGIVIENGG
ncbi:phage tail protein [Pseudaestuariivita atlantica]|uniref:Phage tail protein n=1 Tax=Pseudaestuariivita atlantica TaxID=1317121 RepID=A0A0L1JNU2_9RHOB|nr:phage tail protein [Pseudaestuariivita atlantica]KNG93068.1 phage tail protein [Pseudaestuariivita atlantica]